MRVNANNHLWQRLATVSGAAQNPSEQPAAVAQDRVETSHSTVSPWARIGLAGAGLTMACTSLMQPALAMPRDFQPLAPQPDVPTSLQPSKAVDLQADSEANRWNLAPLSVSANQNVQDPPDFTYLFAQPLPGYSFPTQTDITNPTPAPPPKVPVRPLFQSNSISCGQTSVAMAINAIKGSQLKDTTISYRYGFSLLGALNAESRVAGVQWKDAGRPSPSKWPQIEKAVRQGLPVIVGLNGREFSPSGRGHIVTIVGVDGNKVEFADPAHGNIRQTTKDAIDRAPSYPQGSFIFLPFRFRL